MDVDDRERYVSGTCALDLVHEVPQDTFVRVLRSMIRITFYGRSSLIAACQDEEEVGIMNSQL